MKKYFIAGAIVAVALFLRTSQLASLPPGLYPDEAMNGNNALEALTTHQWKVFYPENNGREGLFINIQSLFVSSLGNKPWVLRLPSALFGTLTVVGLFFLGNILFQNTSAAFIASFLLATSFWHINFSRIGFRAVTSSFWLVWALYFLIRSFQEKKYIVSAVIGGLLYGLGFHSYIAYRATPFLIIVIGFVYLFNAVKANRKNILKAAGIFTACSLLTFAPLGIYFLQNPQDFFGRTGQLSVFASPTPFHDLGINIAKTAGMFNFAGDGNWRHNIANQPELFWPIGILFLFGLGWCFWKIAIQKKWRSIETILISWLAITALPVVISNEGIPHALRAIIMIPAVFLIAALGGTLVLEYISSRIGSRFIPVSLFFIASLLVFQAYYAYFIAWGENPETAGAFSANYVSLAQELNALPLSTPKFIIVEAQGGLVRGIPMPTQTIMFLTDTFTPEKQASKHMYYIATDQADSIPLGSYVTILK